MTAYPLTPFRRRRAAELPLTLDVLLGQVQIDAGHDAARSFMDEVRGAISAHVDAEAGISKLRDTREVSLQSLTVEQEELVEITYYAAFWQVYADLCRSPRRRVHASFCTGCSRPLVDFGDLAAVTSCEDCESKTAEVR